jgi:hypothetical protein
MSTQHPDGETPQMPQSVQPVQAAATTEAVKRASNQATVVTCVAATVPTVLAMQGMASLAVDLLHFAVVVAIALAGFLELALISFALLTRASALAGRPGGVDAAAVWGVSLASGTFSALHELVGPAIGNTQVDRAAPCMTTVRARCRISPTDATRNLCGCLPRGVACPAIDRRTCAVVCQERVKRGGR